MSVLSRARRPARHNSRQLPQWLQLSSRPLGHRGGNADKRGGSGGEVGKQTAGFAIALAVTRLIRGLLFGVSPADPIAFAGIAALLLVVALLSALRRESIRYARCGASSD